MKTILISRFKAECIRMLKDVEMTGEPIVVTHRGKPLVRVEPIQIHGQKKIMGGLKGKITVLGDIVNTNDSSAWEALSS
jgi:prevent-host-death family protein